MSTIAHRAALLHHRTLERQRGELVRYQRHDASEPIELMLVPAGAEIEDAMEGDASASSVAHYWLGVASTIQHKIGRLPENLDTITRVDPELDDSLLSDQSQQEAYRVARGSSQREWQPHGRHGGLIRFRTVLI